MKHRNSEIAALKSSNNVVRLLCTCLKELPAPKQKLIADTIKIRIISTVS